MCAGHLVPLEGESPAKNKTNNQAKQNNQSTSLTNLDSSDHARVKQN